MRNLENILVEQKMSTVELAELIYHQNDRVVSCAKDLAVKMNWDLSHFRIKSELGPIKALDLNKTQALAVATQLAPDHVKDVVGYWKKFESLRPSTLNEAEHALKYLMDELREQASLIQLCKAELGIENGYTTAEIAAELDLDVNGLNLMLADWKVQHWINGHWVLGVAYQELGLVAEATLLDEKFKFNGNLKWTKKGRTFLRDHFSKETYVQPTSLQRLKLLKIFSSGVTEKTHIDVLVHFGLCLMSESELAENHGGQRIS